MLTLGEDGCIRSWKGFSPWEPRNPHLISAFSLSQSANSLALDSFVIVPADPSIKDSILPQQMESEMEGNLCISVDRQGRVNVHSLKNLSFLLYEDELPHYRPPLFAFRIEHLNTHTRHHGSVRVTKNFKQKKEWMLWLKYDTPHIYHMLLSSTSKLLFPLVSSGGFAGNRSSIRKLYRTGFGESVASLGFRGDLRLWKVVQSGSLTLQSEAEVNPKGEIAILNDGHYFAHCNGNDLEIWDASSTFGKLLTRFPSPDVERSTIINLFDYPAIQKRGKYGLISSHCVVGITKTTSVLLWEFQIRADKTLELLYSGFTKLEVDGKLAILSSVDPVGWQSSDSNIVSDGQAREAMVGITKNGKLYTWLYSMAIHSWKQVAFIDTNTKGVYLVKGTTSQLVATGKGLTSNKQFLNHDF